MRAPSSANTCTPMIRDMPSGMFTTLSVMTVFCAVAALTLFRNVVRKRSEKTVAPISWTIGSSRVSNCSMPAIDPSAWYMSAREFPACDRILTMPLARRQVFDDDQEVGNLALHAEKLLASGHRLAIKN